MISLVGNCQLHRMQYVMEINDVKDFTFLANTEALGLDVDLDEIKEAVAKSDVVIAQPIMNPAHALHHAVLRDLNPNIIFTPYIFLDGLFSLSCSGGIADYIYGQDDAITALKTLGFGAGAHAFRSGTMDLRTTERLAASLKELQRRETEQCDVVVSDVILTDYQSEQLFTTHNHPGPRLFDVYCARTFAAAGLPYRPARGRSHFDQVVYAFNRTLHVLSPYDVDTLGLRFPYEEDWYGNGMQMLTNLAGRPSL